VFDTELTTPFDLMGQTVWVAGHRGMVGSAIVRRLADEPIAGVVTASSSEVDLTRQDQTEAFVRDAAPDVAIIAAARVGGIHANRSSQAAFLYENIMIAANAIEACRQSGVAKVVVLGSSCIYPREAPQPMREEHLLTGPLEATNEGYAVAKIAALELGKMYRRQYGMDCISLMPTNLYGPQDNFDLTNSHVLPALLRKIHDAKVEGRSHIEAWGTGTPMREFLHVDDLADAVIHATQHYTGEQHLNVGTGDDVTIRELTQIIAAAVGWDGEVRFDAAMPDGTPRKLLDVSRLAQLGWTAGTDLRAGIDGTYRWFLEHVDAGDLRLGAGR
jgi:GDP-L-fucose synthase